MTQKVARQSGVLLDREQFAYQLALRLCTARRLARLAGVHEVLVSRARHGHPIAERSLRKIVKALLAIPLQPGAELLVARPAGDVASPTASASTAPAVARKKRARAAS